MECDTLQALWNLTFVKKYSVRLLVKTTTLSFFYIITNNNKSINIILQVKQQAKQAKFEERSSSIVEKAIRTHGDVSAPAGSRPNPVYLVRTANRVRQMDRPKDPSDLHDEVSYSEKILTNVNQ